MIIKQEFISGVLNPVSWNNNGAPVGYSIFTEKDEDILLQGKNVEKNFQKFKNQNVKIYGHFLNKYNGARVFKVTRTYCIDTAA